MCKPEETPSSEWQIGRIIARSIGSIKEVDSDNSVFTERDESYEVGFCTRSWRNERS